MTRLWDKGAPLDEAVLRLTVGRDPELDRRLLEADCTASMAHATMLQSIGILTSEELERLHTELAAIAREANNGTFVIDIADEDGHTAIENRLTERLGDAGRKIHTARSRNDQIIAALRLWGRDAVLDQIDGLVHTVTRLLDLAERHGATTVPGYTHTRQAMPTTLGHFFAAWAETLLDNAPWLETAFRHLNRSPLGSASGFGVGLEIDRQMVSDLLRFDTLQVNTLAVQNDRGKSEYLALSVAAATATDLGRLATDLIWYSSEAFGFVELPERLTTGSSIMPQKRNPDVLELIRAGSARLRSRQAEIGAVYGSLTAGYHRDLQLTKEPFLDGMTSLEDMLVAMYSILDALEVDPARCRDALRPETSATDQLYARVRTGASFRTAYKEQAAATAAVPTDPETWQQRSHDGAPGSLGIERQKLHVDDVAARLARTRRSIALDLLPDGRS